MLVSVRMASVVLHTLNIVYGAYSNGADLNGEGKPHYKTSEIAALMGSIHQFRAFSHCAIESIPTRLMHKRESDLISCLAYAERSIGCVCVFVVSIVLTTAEI